MLNQSEYSEPIVRIVSSSNLDESKEKQKREEAIRNILATGAVAGAGIAAAKLFKNNDSVQEFMRSRSVTPLLDQGISNNTSFSSYRDLKSGPITFSDVVLESVRKAEEYSPFNILRTFNTSHIISPFVMGDNVEFNIDPESIDIQKPYLKKLLDKEGNIGFDDIDKRFGFRVTGGSLFEVKEDGTTGRKILNKAYLANTHIKLGENSKIYSNAPLEKFANILGVEPNFSFTQLFASEHSSMTVIGSKSNHGIKLDWARAQSRAIFERAARIWDAPVDSILDYDPTSKIANRLRPYVRLDMGTKGDYTQSIPKSLAMMAENFSKGALKLGAGYLVADLLVTSVADEGSAYSKGILEGISTSAVNAHIAYAETVGDNFQAYKQKQEYLAPGSTDLMTLAGAPLALGMAGGTISYGKRLYDTATKSVEEAESLQHSKSKIFGESNIINRTFQKGGKLGRAIANAEAGRNMRYFWRGMAAGSLLMAPFVPGALIGESSEDLRKVYSGEEDVAIRKNRWWFSGGTEFEGQEIKYFTKHWYARLMSEGKTKSLYGDKQTERDLNPLLHPFDYLRDPYKFEKMHQEDRPYAVWGMDISLGSFLGKTFEKTIGQVIKPDKVNPLLEEYLSNKKPGSIVGAIDGVSPMGTPELLNNAIETDVYDLTVPISDKDASLIEDGMMIAPPSATLEPYREAGQWAYSAGKDFLGLFGWVFGQADDALLGENVLPPQLSRSGEATNMARDFVDLNVGGAFGLTEAQRRILPTSSGAIYERVNPLKNNMPNWLPGEGSDYYIDFSTGDPFEKIENGEFRLPGVGYAAINPILEGVDPADYPDIFKMKILSDIALGSSEYYNVRNRIEEREERGSLTEYELGMLDIIRDQEAQRSVKKRFHEYKTDEDLKDVGLLGRLANKYWETVAHNIETPLEKSTFFRPAGKLIHQRTAIEDYKNEMYGGDLAMWDTPYKSFIKPTIDSTIGALDNDYVPESVEERRNVDEYFDKLRYLKHRRLYKDAVASGDNEAARTHRAEYQKTLSGALTSDIDTEQELLRSYIALPDQERAYFASFVNAEGDDREVIEQMLPRNISAIYKTVWHRKDAVDNAISIGGDPNAALRMQAENDNAILRQSYEDEYQEYAQSQTEGTSFKEYLADAEAEAYLEQVTGIPDESFVGWDPRIDLDEVKLRTIQIGEEDMHDYGFWQSDEERLRRLIALSEEEQVVTRMEDIKDGLKERGHKKDEIRRALMENGFFVKNIELINSNQSNISINVEAE